MAEDLATDEVLGMSSSVRVDFIEYLGRLFYIKNRIKLFFLFTEHERT